MNSKNKCIIVLIALISAHHLDAMQHKIIKPLSLEYIKHTKVRTHKISYQYTITKPNVIDSQTNNTSFYTFIGMLLATTGALVYANYLETEPNELEEPALCWAAKNPDDIWKMRLLLALRKDVNQRNERGESPLYIATHYGNYDIAKLCIESGADVNLTTHAGGAPLHVSAGHGQFETTELLVEANANVNQVKWKNGMSPLQYARASGNEDIVRLLIHHGAKYKPNKA